MKPFLLVALVAFVAAGCGGGSATTDVYTRADTKQCIEETLDVHSFPPVGDDFVASTASNGALRGVRVGDNAVTILFGQSPEEANNLADAYRRFRARNVGIEDVLRTSNNAVLLWQNHPSATDESNIAGCLK